MTSINLTLRSLKMLKWHLGGFKPMQMETAAVIDIENYQN